jgi:basic amino acid/polyamine antiporter, APA family
MARAGYIPHTLARLHPRRGSPAAALIFIGTLNIGGIFVGKAAIEPITDMCAMVLTLTYVMCCMTVLRLRSRSGVARFALPGGSAFAWIGLLGSVVMTMVAFLAPFWQRDGLPLEWKLLGVWGVIGCAVWLSSVRYAAHITPP